MYCKNYKIRTMQKLPYCILNKEWNPICQGCTNKEYKIYKLMKQTKPLNKVSKRQAKAERERKSLFTNDLTKCIGCPNKQNLKVSKHEIFRGRNRQNSMKHDLVIPLCLTCHNDPKIERKWQIKGQKKFVKRYGYDKFIEVFKMDYIERLKKR